MTADIDTLRAALRASGDRSSDFDLNPDVSIPGGRVLRDAAVLVAIMEGADGLDVLLTKRSSALKHHPGQVAFPGGKKDNDDADLPATALREAWEEVRLNPDHVDIIGTLPTHETVTSFTVTPVVGLVTGDFQAEIEPNEVAEAFTVPLHHVLDPDRYRVESRLWQGRRRYYYAVPFGPYYIWGATARILRGLADRVASCR
ncbi:CoA pyrophosphatase [Pseudaestuariivita atlantica]|uniref:Nudix hydrolase domain-containing protein n=1 Tax=Pseudaestuariivita atlantica TaxID=1317121 RepID=A0A0L1JPJ3_9RHOB|nr:CoA pyrophosphatase [Pseudaestuariivita atlantica]KNG93684.1 hypothetical protein ATO11_10850 [Pseudaestuariivita atlantica]